MQAYRCKIRLQDYLFFATTERGKTFETGMFIHNYALTYALVMAGVMDFPNPESKPAYYYEKQIPQYQKELQPFNEVGIYVTPALPESIRFRNTQFNTQKEGYEFGDKARSIAYPDWGFLRMICPQGTFVFYVLSIRDDFKLKPQKYIRLGKFSCKASVSWWKAKQAEERKGNFSFKGILNWQDLAQKPYLFNILSGALPSKLIQDCHFENADYYELEFHDTYKISLPVHIGYMADLPKSEKKQKKPRKTKPKQTRQKTIKGDQIDLFKDSSG